MRVFKCLSPTTKSIGGFGSGFFSNYRIILEQLMMFNKSNDNTIPYIDWGETAWVEGYNPFGGDVLIKKENPFDSWFTQEIPNENDKVIEFETYVPQGIIHHGTDYFDTPSQLNEQQKVDKLYLKPKKHILDKINEIYNKEFEGEVVLGVIARGCEFNYYHPNYGVFSVDDYVQKVKKILEDNPEITKLFIVSEDLNYVVTINESFSNSYFIPNVFRRTTETNEYMNKNYLWPNIDNKRDNQNNLLGEETIIQTKLLGKCQYLFGIHTGIFCGAILWNENIKKIFKI